MTENFLDLRKTFTDKKHLFVGSDWIDFVDLVDEYGYIPFKLLSITFSRLVILAKQINNTDFVILKFVLLENDSFCIEAEISELLKLPNTICPLNSIRCYPFGLIVFPYIQNVKHYRLLLWKDWLIVLKQLLETLKILHEKDFVHLDINPSNVLLQYNEKYFNVYLIDFGLVHCNSTSLVHENSDMSDYIIGTLPYIDPVLLESGLISDKCDMWSIGIMLAKTISLEPILNYSSISEYIEISKTLPSFLCTDEFKIKSSYEQNKDNILFVLQNLLVLDREKRWSSSEALLHVNKLIEKY